MVRKATLAPDGIESAAFAQYRYAVIATLFTEYYDPQCGPSLLHRPVPLDLPDLLRGASRPGLCHGPGLAPLDEPSRCGGVIRRAKPSSRHPWVSYSGLVANTTPFALPVPRAASSSEPDLCDSTAGP